MNAARHICSTLILGVGILCHPCTAEDALTPEQQALVHHFHSAVSQLEASMRRAQEVLKSTSDTSGADAAVPAIAAVGQAEESVKEAAASLTKAGLGVSRLYKQGDLAKAISSLPIAAYNADIQSTLTNGCHGSVKLYHAITGTSATDEQPQTGLSEQDKADLAEIEQVLASIEAICPDSHWRPLEQEFVRRFDASLPAAARLQQRPLTTMLLHRLLEQHAKWLYRLGNEEFHHNGDLEERFLLHPQNYIGQWYDPHSFRNYFYDKADSLDINSKRPRGKAIWDEAEPRLKELRKKYDLGPGDGRTRETAFDIPADIKEEDYGKFVNEVTRELFRERAMHSTLWSISVGKNGREVVHGVIMVGRPGNFNRNNDSHTIMPCYFNLTRKDKEK